jgi:putative SOS response-associated peptidase YedK
MCGRYSLTTPPEAMRRLFHTSGALLNVPPRYNIAPTQEAAVVRLRAEGGRELVLLRWGLVPSWSQGPDSGYGMINARAETVADKPAFRGAFRRRRCLVPADGFYEWRKEGARKQPYRVRLEDGGLFSFAGLWEHWEGGPEGAPQAIESFTIIVTDANELLKPIHERMPVIVAPSDHDAWLDAEGTRPEDAAALLRPFPADRMEAYRVSLRVNSPRNDDPGCIAPLQDQPAR